MWIRPFVCSWLLLILFESKPSLESRWNAIESVCKTKLTVCFCFLWPVIWHSECKVVIWWKFISPYCLGFSPALHRRRVVLYKFRLQYFFSVTYLLARAATFPAGAYFFFRPRVNGCVCVRRNCKYKVLSKLSEGHVPVSSLRIELYMCRMCKINLCD